MSSICKTVTDTTLAKWKPNMKPPWLLMAPWPLTLDDLEPYKFRLRYLKYRDRYNVRHNRGQIGNHQWASDWYNDLWPWITLNSPSSRSLKLHVKYFKNGERYDDGVNRSRCTWQTLIWMMGWKQHALSRYTFCGTYFLFLWTSGYFQKQILI